MRVLRNEDGVPCVEVELDKPRRVAFDMAAIERAVKTEGVGAEIFERVSGEEGIMHLPTLIWVGLATDAPDLERDRIRRMLHLGNILTIAAAINALAAASFPEAEEEKKPDPLDRPKPKAKAKPKAKG